MANKNIGMLPQATQLADDSLLVAEQQGTAVRLTGAQLKSYAKQGVELEFREDLEASQAAADRAQSAASAVVDMTVSASGSGAASVTKSLRDGKVHLDFGLPRGEQGVPGPEGQTGPRGPKGDPGTGLKLLGYYGAPQDLEAAVAAPEAGDAYGVGLEAPYDVYVFDGVSMDWKNYGPLSGGGGAILPENVVTSEGGASLEIPAAFGDAPHVITITGEEEPPLTADDVQYSETQTVGEAIAGLFTSVSDGKQEIASAITDMGVPTPQDAAFAGMAENIRQISGGADTSDATATPGDILGGKTAYTASGKVEGIIPSLPARTITPGTADQTIANGQYLGGTQVIRGDQNLTPANIRQGVTLFGVAGAMTSEFKATLTVTADAGAVVTAAHANGTEVSALSANGSVTLELPIEGQWTVTARRGVAQYNSVVVEVSSSYSAKLTAEVHVEYFGNASSLSDSKYDLAAASVGDYALFGGGYRYIKTMDTVDAYNKYLTRSNAAVLNHASSSLAAAASSQYAFFGGGNYSDSTSSSNVRTVTAYDTLLTGSGAEYLSYARRDLAAAAIGGFVLFGGGRGSEVLAVVDVYGEEKTRQSAVPLAIAAALLAAASNGNYAFFAGGTGSDKTTAYNAALTRSTPASLSKARSKLAAARAGNYVLFAGGENNGVLDTVDAYDLFMVRITPEPLVAARSGLTGTTIGDHAVFAGGDPSATDVYDPFLTRTNPDPLKSKRDGLAAASVGRYAIFSGGFVPGETYSNGLPTVEVYQYV